MDVVYNTSNSNTPSILTSAGTVLDSNPARKGWFIQNVGTNPLFVRCGASASSTVYHVVLKGGSANDDGLGGSYSQFEGTVYTGIVSIAGTTPRVVVLEIAP